MMTTFPQWLNGRCIAMSMKQQELALGLGDAEDTIPSQCHVFHTSLCFYDYIARITKYGHRVTVNPKNLIQEMLDAPQTQCP
jgi:hypothetical protein